MVLKVRVYATCVNLKIAKDTVVLRNNTFYTCKAFWITFMYMSLYAYMYIFISWCWFVYSVFFTHDIKSCSFVFHVFLICFSFVIMHLYRCIMFYHVVWFQVAFQTKASQGRCLASCKGVWEFFGERGMVVTSYRFLNLSVMFFDLSDVFLSLFIPVFNSTWGNIHSYVD